MEMENEFEKYCVEHYIKAEKFISEYKAWKTHTQNAKTTMDRMKMEPKEFYRVVGIYEAYLKKQAAEEAAKAPKRRAKAEPKDEGDAVIRAAEPEAVKEPEAEAEDADGKEIPPEVSQVWLSSPWAIWTRELQMMFADDPNVKIVVDEEAYTVKVIVHGQDKWTALSQMLPKEKVFGNVVLRVHVFSDGVVDDPAHLLANAFRDNPRIMGIFRAERFGRVATFGVFKREIVQFFADNGTDIGWNKSMLAEDIARELFVPMTDVFYCTEPANGEYVPDEER